MSIENYRKEVLGNFLVINAKITLVIYRAIVCHQRNTSDEKSKLLADNRKFFTYS